MMNENMKVPLKFLSVLISSKGQGEITEEDVKAQPHVDVLDSKSFTPLHWACYYGQLSSVTILIAYVKFILYKVYSIMYAS